MIPSLAFEHFRQSIDQAPIDLARATFTIAAAEYPELDIDAQLRRIDDIAAAIADRLPASRYPMKVITTINDYLFTDLGYSGNQTDYYDPRNSYLNDILDRRTGIPISLCVLYLEIAKRLNFPMVGIGMPGHFIIRPTIDDMDIYVDPFHKGEILFTADCQTRLSQVYGRPVELKPEMLAPVSTTQILYRMLTNLKMVYLRHEQFERALAMVDRLLLLNPGNIHEIRDRGLILYELARWDEAAIDLEAYLAHSPMDTDSRTIGQLLTYIRSQI
jgi:regulator of sirC expression with transglutaminase-like and TPR domain